MIFHEQQIDEFFDSEPDRQAIKQFCQHYAFDFWRSKIDNFASQGGKALWAKMTPEERKERVNKMIAGRKPSVDKSK